MGPDASLFSFLRFPILSSREIMEVGKEKRMKKEDKDEGLLLDGKRLWESHRLYPFLVLSLRIFMNGKEVMERKGWNFLRLTFLAWNF